MSNTQSIIDWVNSLPVLSFMDEPKIKDSFLKNCINIKALSMEEAEHFYNKECLFLRRIIMASADIQSCTTFSLYAAFMDISLNPEILSLNPDDKLTYIETRGYKTGKRGADNRDIYEKRARLIISPYGELAIRMDVGQIRYADEPIVVYEGDHFDLETEKGRLIPHYKAKIPRKPGTRIVGGFIVVTRADGSLLTSYMLEDDVARLAAYSTRQNKGKTNALYGLPEEGQGEGRGIDKGFFQAKLIKHSFKTFPKVRIKASNAAIEDDDNGQDEGSEIPPSESFTPPTRPVVAERESFVQETEEEVYFPRNEPDMDEYSGTF